MQKKYYKNHKRNIRKEAVIIEEGMIVIGSDVDTDMNTIEKITKDFIKQFEEENNTKVLHWAIHNHEGHIDENGEFVANRHVHLLFDNVDQDGNMIRRNWKRTYFNKLQDNIYNISKKYIKNIERAENIEKTETNEHHRDYARRAEKERIQKLTQKAIKE